MNSTATLTNDSINSSDTNITSTPAISRMSRLLRRCLGAVMITTIGVGAALTAGAAPASAWSYGASTGTPGAVTVPVIYVGDLAYGYTLYGNTPVTAYRVAGTTGIQTVTVAYQVQRFVNGQWVLGAQTILNRTMAANQSSVQFPAPYFNPSSTCRA